MLESGEAENVIYCKSFSDYLFNVGTFVTKTKEVILEYVTEDSEKYVIADVTFENGDCFKGVKFKVVINESTETPHSTINLNELTGKTYVELPKQQKQVIEESEEVIEEPAPIFTASPLIETPDYTETVNEALELQKKLKLQREELKKQQILLEKQDTVKRKLNEYKQELLEEYFNATKKQSETLNTTLNESIELLEKDLLERITNSFNDYSVQFEATAEISQKQKLEILLTKIDEEINKKQTEITNLVSDKILLESDENRKLLADKSKELEKTYGDKLVVELQKYKEELFNDFTELSKVKVDEILSEKGPELFEKIKGIEDKVKKLIEEKTKFAEKGKFTEEQQKYIADTAQYWARRLLDLGGGGGSVAVQYANGGVMNGNLSVNNLYPNNGLGEIGTPSNRWDRIYANQIDSLSSNIVVELSGFFVNGDFTVNGIISAVGGNSTEWNNVYNNVNTNSAKWESVYSNVNSNSANYILDGGNTKGATLNIGTNDAFNLNLETNNTTRVTVLSGGEIGIGTITPNTSLTVVGTISTNNDYSSNIWADTYTTVKNFSASWEETADIGAVADRVTNIQQITGSWQQTYTNVSTNSANYILDGGNTKAANISIGTNDVFNLNLETNNTSRITLLSSGEVFIPSKINITSIENAVINDKLFYFYTSSYQLSPLSGNYSEGLFIGKKKLTQSNTLLTNFGNTFLPAAIPLRTLDLDSSADGKYQTAAVMNVGSTGLIYVSKDYGRTWSSRPGAGVRSWSRVAMSYDGKYQTATVGIFSTGFIYTSNDFGETWTQRESIRDWGGGVAMTGDGKVQIAAGSTSLNNPRQLFISNDFGETWTQIPNSPIDDFRYIAMSSDGRVITALGSNVLASQIYVSRDYGISWTAVGPALNWRSIGMSEDGKYQTATALTFTHQGAIYNSNNYGQTWNNVTPSVQSFRGVRVSSDGKNQVATAFNDRVYFSEDYGFNWIAKGDTRQWDAITASSDLKYITLSDYGGLFYTTIADELILGNLLTTGSLSSSSIIYSLSGNSDQWNSTYTTVKNFSASWEDDLNILSTVTNYLSTNNVMLLSATVMQNLSVGGTIYSSATALVIAEYEVLVGNGTNTSFVVNHNFNTDNIQVAVYDVVSNILSYPLVQIIDNNNISVIFNFIPSLNQYRVLVFGTVPSNQINAYGQIFTSYITATGFGDIPALSGYWNTTFQTVCALSALWSQGGQNAVTASYTVTAQDFVITGASSWAVSTLSNTVTGTLPVTPYSGMTIRFLDANKTWAVNNFTIVRSGELIESIAENLNCDISGYSFSLTYVGGSVGWRVY